eukprot:CAMPEP_0172441390 /NCGR_PEP_ID=MMETSP1065-20121228/1935_1 /TAXON_ID=265537 /ORGANISM="Amphiprora paludosa, Strain CCMP125" /LENGTH=198 /DNA_ID=CAMNT_0013190729 /DNA_START=42 /DNA_END=638 /DNA_ORIENTATION=+
MIFSPLLIDADASSSSTYETTTSKKRALSPSSRSVTVRFNESANVAYDNTQICHEDCAELWYTKENLKQLKTTYTNNAKDIIRVESQQKGSKSYCRVMTRVFNSCVDATPLSEADQRHFQKWIAVTSSRVGLERLAVRKIRLDKSIRRQELVYAVLDLQEDPSVPAEKVEEWIAQASQEISQPSRKFAMLLAQAQQKA